MNGVRREVPPLEEREEFSLDGITYEVFNTSGGLGTLCDTLEGVAIPHARIPNLKKPFGILARLRKPIDFDAIDSQPIDLVFFLLLPATSNGEQLNALACVARKFRES